MPNQCKCGKHYFAKGKREKQWAIGSSKFRNNPKIKKTFSNDGINNFF
jgi:hypothetical protein